MQKEKKRKEKEKKKTSKGSLDIKKDLLQNNVLMS